MIIMQGRQFQLDTEWGAVIALMNETGWSWPELTATPAALVAEMAEHIAAKRHWASEKIRLDESMRKK